MRKISAILAGAVLALAAATGALAGAPSHGHGHNGGNTKTTIISGNNLASQSADVYNSSSGDASVYVDASSTGGPAAPGGTGGTGGNGGTSGSSSNCGCSHHNPAPAPGGAGGPGGPGGAGGGAGNGGAVTVNASAKVFNPAVVAIGQQIDQNSAGH
jgi:hypothetical protein